MPFYEKGDVRIRYEEAGSGFTLLLIPGGGLNSTISFFNGNAPFNVIEEFKDEYHCITMDLRHANGGQSSGPLEIDRPWDAYADDQLGLMDHLGLGEFLVLGFCIGGLFIWNLLQRAPERLVAAVLAQPSGFRPEMPDLFYHNNITGWGSALCARRLDITMKMVDAFLNKMYGCLENFLHRGHCHRFEMHPIPQALNAPGEPVNGELPPPLINIVAPELGIRFLTGAQMKDADPDRVGHGDDGPRLPTACGETLIPRREIGPLGLHGCMCQLGQDRPEGTGALAGFTGALLARPVIIAWCHTSPRRQTRRRLQP